MTEPENDKIAKPTAFQGRLPGVSGEFPKVNFMDAEPHRIAVTIMYDGTKYCGWQVQKNALSVQQRMQDALEMLLGFRPDISGCSRTDAGVHANNYVFHMSSDGVSVPSERLPQALNAHLHGSSIAVKRAVNVPADFHARYSCIKKEYIYKIWNAPYLNPFYEGYAWHYPYEIDIDALSFVGEEFCGTHDFRAFMSKGSKITDDTVRTVEYFDVSRQDELVTVRVCADGFLYNMVRIMVGTYVSACAGKLGKGDISKIILNGKRSGAGDTAPACGLYLNRIVY